MNLILFQETRRTEMSLKSTFGCLTVFECNFMQSTHIYVYPIYVHVCPIYLCVYRIYIYGIYIQIYRIYIYIGYICPISSVSLKDLD